MIAARIGPTGKLKLPICAAAGANASGPALVALVAGADVRETRRDARLVNSVAVAGTASAVEPLPVASDAGDDSAAGAAGDNADAGATVAVPVRMLRAEALPNAVRDAALVELCGSAGELIVTEPPPRTRMAAARGRATAEVTLVEAAGAAADSADPVVSASEAGAQASTEPIPNIRASAPTRPTVRACPDAPRRRSNSMLTDRSASTDHQFL